MKRKTPALLVWLTRLIVLGSVLSLSGYLGHAFFLFEQADSFRAQFFIIAIAGLVIAFLSRQWKAFAVLLVVALLHASELARFYLPQEKPNVSPDLRVMSVNLLASNRDAKNLLGEINRVDPDVIVFQEYTTRWHQLLSAALKKHPHRVHEVINTPFGIAAYSRLPYRSQKIDYFNQRLSPAVDVVVETGSGAVRILGIHPIPPVSASTYRMRNQYFEDVRESAQATNGPLVVLGDFNATPWSHHFKKLLADASLTSTRDGAGFHPTWPGRFWPLWIPIDHIIYNKKIQSVRFESGESFGSDHLPVWADLAVLPAAE